MIKELRLINWKSFADSTLYIDPLTILIGTNASGKSNILDALLFLQRISSGISISNAIIGDTGLKGLRGGLEWVARKPLKEFTIELLIASETEEHVDYRYSISIAVNGTKAELYSESLILIKHQLKKGDGTEKKIYYTTRDKSFFPLSVCFTKKGKRKVIETPINESRIIISQIKLFTGIPEIQEAIKSIQEQFQRIFLIDPIPSLMRNYAPISENLQTDAANLAGVLHGLPENQKEIVEQTLSAYLKKLPERDIARVWTEPIGKFRTDAMLYCEEAWSDSEEPTIVDLRGMSDGTVRFLAIVTAMLIRPENSMLIVEEADNGLHPSRAHILVSMLKEIGKQRNIDVIITTHNPAMLDALGNQMVPYISVIHRNSITGASEITLLEDIEKLPKLMASGTVGDIVTNGGIETTLHQRLSP